MRTENQQSSVLRKREKTVGKHHRERVIAGELLAIDPIHKPRGGYKRLLRELLDEYEDETEEQ